MAHELTTTNGQVEFAYLESDGLPWHGLGQALSDNATIDQWRVASGMDWTINRAPVQYKAGKETITMPEQNVLFRSDTQAPLGVVSDRYQVVQPKDVLEFFRNIAKAGGLELSASGTIFGGKRFWATAKIGEASPVSIKDKVGGYLLISTSADGSLSTEARLTSIRAVCNNTLGFARKDAKESFKLSHRSEFDASAIQDAMGLNTASWDAFRNQITRLSNIVIEADKAENFVASLLATGTTQIAQDKARDQKGFSKIISLFNGEGKGALLDGVAGTAWGLLNAITEYSDHHVRARSEEHRFVAGQWGQTADLKQKAFDLLTA